MKIFKIVFGVLMVILIGLLAHHMFLAPTFFDPNSLTEMAFLVFGAPFLFEGAVIPTHSATLRGASQR